MNNVYTNSRPTESFCKLKSSCGLHGNLDIHGMEWSERAILKVVAFDRTNGVLIVQNENGLKWNTDLKKMQFCLENGNSVPK